MHPTTPTLTVRELHPTDIPNIASYWVDSPPEHLLSMGVDLAKVPDREAFTGMLAHQLALPLQEKQAYALIWLVNGTPAGHCNVNPIQFGEEAKMHLHFWHAGHRQRGMGTALVRLSLPWFFRELALKRLICEPYAHNPAPNKTLARLGFAFERQYTTIPGSINTEQEVKRWVLTREAFEAMRLPQH